MCVGGCVCVCPHLAAWLHMLSTLAIKVEPCAFMFLLCPSTKHQNDFLLYTTILFEEENVQITDLLSNNILHMYFIYGFFLPIFFLSIVYTRLLASAASPHIIC